MAKEIGSKASSLMERLLKNSTIKKTEPLLESSLLNEQERVSTSIPMINYALGGTFNGGIGSGITTIAGPSRHFKTSFGLVMVAAYLKKYPDAVCYFYNNEFGAKKTYFEQYGVDTSRVIHAPFEDLEKLKFDITTQLEELSDKDKVIFFIDSIGNAASIKEIDDALAGKSAADMTRAKQIKSILRIITPKLYIKNIPLILIAHVYKTQEMFSKDVVSGGDAMIYNPDAVWIIGKNQLKEKDEITGSKFIIRVNKSRYVKERAQFPITVRWGEGIAKWSGFEEVAEQLNVIIPSKIGRSAAYTYNSIDGKDYQVLASDIDSDDDFWNRIINETDLTYRMESLYNIGAISKEKLSFSIEEDID